MIAHQFCYLPSINGIPFASITGRAEIVTVPAGGRVARTGWSIGRLFVDLVGADYTELPENHWLYQPLKLWLLQSEAERIHALWSATAEAVPA